MRGLAIESSSENLDVGQPFLAIRTAEQLGPPCPAIVSREGKVRLHLCLMRQGESTASATRSTASRSVTDTPKFPHPRR